MRALTPSEAQSRAARLRRIVRNGEEMRKLLAIMREDIYHEYIDQVHGTDRWEQRRDDYWSTLEKNYGGLQVTLPASVSRARNELEALGEPESFTRKKPEPPREEKPEDYSKIMLEALSEPTDDDRSAAICNL